MTEFQMGLCVGALPFIAALWFLSSKAKEMTKVMEKANKELLGQSLNIHQRIIELEQVFKQK